MVLGIGKVRRKSQSVEPANPALAAWVSQGEEPGDGTPWREAKAEKRSTWWWVFRVVLVIVAIAVVATLVRSFVSSQTPAPVAVETEAPLPDAEARALAERFVESFYSWDSAAPQQRKQNLAADIPMNSTATSGLGWDGKGHQIATDARATTAEITDDGLMHVSVVFRLVGFDADGAALSPIWSQAVVPISLEDDTRVAIAGMPGMVPVDVPLESTAKTPEMDNAVTTDTKEYAQSFFAALGAQEDVNAEAAPGNHIRGLAGAVELVRVDSWKVWAGDGHTREAVAVVIWRNSVSEFTSEYAVTLTKITGGGQSKWLVSAIRGTAK